MIYLFYLIIFKANVFLVLSFDVYLIKDQALFFSNFLYPLFFYLIGFFCVFLLFLY